MYYYIEKMGITHSGKRKDDLTMKRIARLAVLVLVSLLVSSLFAVSAAELSDIKGHWAEEYIEYGIEQGYISGYEDGTFLPNKTVTRAEFSKMINSAVKMTSTGDAKGEFNDVSSKDWYFAEVKKAENAGYITGYEDGTFRPNNSITRQEAAVILSRIVLPTSERQELTSFADSATVDGWAEDAVSMIAAKGYIKGDENKQFNPKGALTRSQAAKLICEFVKNENVVNKNQTINPTSNKVVFSETLFTDDVIIDFEEETELTVNFENCRVIGKIIVKLDGVQIDLKNSKVNGMSIEAEDAFVTLDRDSEVKKTSVSAPATFVGGKFNNVVLDGHEVSIKLSTDCEKVEVKGDAFIDADEIGQLDVSAKSSLVIQSGTIEKLTVDEAAKGSTINLASKVVVKQANNKAPVTYIGKGKIEKADNQVTGVVFDGVTVVETTGKKPTDGEGNGETDDEFFEDVTVSPANKKSSVSITSKIIFTFDEEVFNKDGKELTAGYIEDNFKIMRGSEDGTKTAFTATVASNNKKVTLEPASNLRNGTTYYVIIPEGVLAYEDASVNGKYSSYFKTIAASGEDDESSSNDDEDEEASVTMSPKNGAEDVSVTTSIKLTFDGTLKAYSGTLDEEYIEEEAIEIREGSKTGETVSFSASINSKTITLVPSRLLGETDYYVVILGNKLKVGGSTLSKTTLSFTTEEGTAISISPANGATNISLMPEITVSFAEPMLQMDGEDELTEDYIQDEVILFRKTSATKTADEFQVSYSVTEIAENGRKLVIVPDDELESGTTYYIIVVEESLVGETTETENAKVTSSFKTASAMAPMFTPYDEQENVAVGTEIKISFSDVLMTNESKKEDRREVDDEYLAELIDDDYITFKRGTKKLDISATIDGDGKTVIITPEDALDPEKTYTLSIKSKAFYSKTSTTKYNAAGSVSFDTNIAMSPAITPKDEAEDVSLTVNPTIKFSEKIYNDDGKELKSLYLKRSITFVDQYGEEVDFTVSIDGSTITVEPEENLEGNVAYTLTLLAGTIQNEDGIFNEEKSVTFTTKVSNTIEITPASAAKASPLVNPTVKFGTALYTVDGDPVDEEYASEYIFLTEGTKSSDVDDAIPATIEMSEDGRTFTIIPEDVLEFETKYYVNVVAKKFLFADEETENVAKNSYFTVIKEPALSKVSGSSSSKNSAKITFTSNVADSSDDELAQIVVEDENGEILKTQAITSTSSSSVTIKSLEADTDYTFFVYIVYDGEIESEPVEVTVKTRA